MRRVDGVPRAVRHGNEQPASPCRLRPICGWRSVCFASRVDLIFARAVLILLVFRFVQPMNARREAPKRRNMFLQRNHEANSNPALRGFMTRTDTTRDAPAKSAPGAPPPRYTAMHRTSTGCGCRSSPFAVRIVFALAGFVLITGHLWFRSTTGTLAATSVMFELVRFGRGEANRSAGAECAPAARRRRAHRRGRRPGHCLH